MCFKYVLARVSKALLLINQTVVGGRCCCHPCSPGGETEAPRGEKPVQVMAWLVFGMQPRQPGLSIAARMWGAWVNRRDMGRLVTLGK